MFNDETNLTRSIYDEGLPRLPSKIGHVTGESICNFNENCLGGPSSGGIASCSVDFPMLLYMTGAFHGAPSAFPV